MTEAFVVASLAETTLVGLIARLTGVPQDVLTRKVHGRYFDGCPGASDDDPNRRGYLEHIGVKTIVVENNYTDRDFLEDYAAYYVRCFHQYPRTCHRLHFFCSEFTESDFLAVLSGQGELGIKALQEAYAGFMVLRPLPDAVIGRTCLKHYDDSASHRQFPLSRPVRASLFGIGLEVRTVPFQEQDQVTSACATSALWSAFQITGRMFQHRIPSPVQITQAATRGNPVDSRSFPNTDGLTLTQMAEAVRDVGLEPLLLNRVTRSQLQAAIRAYTSAGIPLVLILQLERHVKGRELRPAYHAVTVTGYGLADRPCGRWHHELIDRLYVNDDGVGPHARMRLSPDSIWDCTLTTSWGMADDTAVRAVPRALLVPAYHKIRIPLSTVFDDIRGLADALESVGSQGVPAATDLHWDVTLTDIVSLKSGIFANRSRPPGDSWLLTAPLPKYIWRTVARRGETVILQALFDATDIAAGRYLLDFDVRDQSLRDWLDIVLVEGSHPTKQVKLIKQLIDKQNPGVPRRPTNPPL